MVAEALPEIHVSSNLRAVQILPNHHARLASIASDHGPLIDGRYLFPNYIFLSEKPPAYFWGFNGVVRCLKSEIHPAELTRARQAYISLRREQQEQESLGMLKSAVVSLHSVDGHCIATVELFNRSLKVRVKAA